MERVIRIGTRESHLAIWQATEVQTLLKKQGTRAELIFIKSEGDVDLKTPLYEMGIQGIFTRSLDIALLDRRIDVAVHSMKDVPTQLPEGVSQAAVLRRGPATDLLVFKPGINSLNDVADIATSSIRRRAQWLHKYPNHRLHNLRGNVNTRLEKLSTGNWDAAIFALAGLERIGLRPVNSIVLDWMLPAPAQGAIIAVCRSEDHELLEVCNLFNDESTALCTKIERQFLRALLGGCSTPISALAEIRDEEVHFKGNIFSPDGKYKAEIEKKASLAEADGLGDTAAKELLNRGGKEIADKLQHEPG